ncbi:hypothetical protein PROFUN_03539 [Planoprotostelium fungivorum]|uniref:Autophagy-related protein 27 n=1 Tax=Planoprotostelium fungivorum TaxID=1890364 RepID=A0A2P6MSF4_9EUKA|nr:hypothetical protein PROFUN_03539 [Planoprotostelium fungivorum]
MFTIILLLSAIHLAYGACTNIDSSLEQCAFSAPDGKRYDLKSFNTSTPLSYTTDAGIVYHMTVCSSVSLSGDPSTSVWQTSGGLDTVLTDICRQNVTSVGGPEKSQGDVEGFRITSRSVPGLPFNNIVDIDFICDPNIPSPGVGVSASGKQHTYAIVWKSAGACALTEGKEKGEFLGIGWIISIVFLGLVVLYLIVGIIVNKFVMKKESTEVIPNVHVWQSVGAHVKDGFKFTYRKIIRKDTTYTAV